MFHYTLLLFNCFEKIDWSSVVLKDSQEGELTLFKLKYFVLLTDLLENHATKRCNINNLLFLFSAHLEMLAKLKIWKVLALRWDPGGIILPKFENLSEVIKIKYRDA